MPCVGIATRPVVLLMASSAGKRERERQKLEKAKVKAERKAARQASDAQSEDGSSSRTESELIEDLGDLQRAFETGTLSLEDFEERRDRLQAEFEQLT
jgi:hypothetical protein